MGASECLRLACVLALASLRQPELECSKVLSDCHNIARKAVYNYKAACSLPDTYIYQQQSKNRLIMLRTILEENGAKGDELDQIFGGGDDRRPEDVKALLGLLSREDGTKEELEERTE